MSKRAHRRRSLTGFAKRKFAPAETEVEAPVTVSKDPSIMLPDEWWWTVTTKPSECNDCENAIDASEVIAFESHRKVVLCVACAIERGIEDQTKESKRFKEAMDG